VHTPDREPDLPEPLAAHLDSAPQAAATWAELTPEQRHALAGWIHRAWFERGERTRAEELFEVLSAGSDALAAWTQAQQELPGSTSGFFSIP
jgi:uncharacterized protein YdeI (YjbR/CyaY-like superfamily)